MNHYQNISHLENELDELKKNLQWSFLNNTAFFIISILFYTLIHQMSLPYNHFIGITTLVISYGNIAYQKEQDLLKIKYYWERVLHRSKEDIRVKRYLDLMFEREAFLFINKENNKYSIKPNISLFN